MLKRFISVFLTVMLLASMFTGVVFAQSATESVKNHYSLWFKTSGAATENNTYITYWSDRESYSLYDFKDVIPYIYGAEKIQASTSYHTGGRVYGMVLTALDDSYEQYINSSLTYSSASAHGMLRNGYVLINDTDKTEYTTKTFDVNKEALIAALETGDDSIVAVRFSGVKGGGNSQIAGLTFKFTYDDVTYMQTIANEFEWEDISEVSSDAVTENLNLPQYYAGCEVAWESDNTAVNAETGVVIVGKGDQHVTLTATLSHNGKTVTKEFELTVPGEKRKEITVKYQNYGSARSYENLGISMSRFINLGGSYAGVAQLNLSGYEEILKNPGTSIKLGLRSEANMANGNLSDYTVYLAPDKADVYKVGDTYTSVQALGAFDTSRPVLAIDNDGITTSAAGTLVTVDANKENLIKVLDEVGSQNSIVTLYITTTSKSAADMTKDGLTISYFESEIDDAAYPEELKEDFKLENLTTDSAESLVNNLPAFFRGATVEWSSDKDVISADGKLKRSKEADVEATLVATVSYKNGGFTKSFDAVIAKLIPTVKTVSMSAISYIGAASADSVLQSEFSAYYLVSAAHGDSTANGRGDRHVFMKFDLSKVLKELDAATKITLNIGNRLPQGNSGMITVMSNRFDKWDNTLTYNMATRYGMYSDRGYHIEYGVPFNTSKTVVDSSEFQQAVKEAVAANPDEGLVTFRISSSDYNQNSFQINGAAGTPYIEISYFEDDLKTDAELLASKKGSVQWAAVTSQDIDNVVADLTLPATWYGSEIIWASGDENVISKDGKVTIGETAKEVILTATVDGVANEFKITVPASKLAVKSEYTHRENDIDDEGKRDATVGSNLNYTEAILYANEDIAGTPDVILAIYNEDRTVLESVSVIEDVTIKKGYNCLISEHHYVFDKKVTKAIVVDDMASLTPLAVAR